MFIITKSLCIIKLICLKKSTNCSQEKGIRLELLSAELETRDKQIGCMPN